MVESLRVLGPFFVGTGVAPAEEIGVETFEQRLRDEWEKTRAAITPGINFYVWATSRPEVTLATAPPDDWRCLPGGRQGTSGLPPRSRHHFSSKRR